ncbi:hypothetical protein [Pseudonocardia pini]|uniref:hypothetical protein n=1 Tax=Pseudonocardia pini TaxID=2758030 RepID=UPI0028A5C41D|nr:hypothetical protein [Pseudonocardia pini]
MRTVLVTGYDDRTGQGYVVRTGPDLAVESEPGVREVTHAGVTVLCTDGLAILLKDALAHRPVTRLGWAGPEVPLTLDDHTLLAWLTDAVGGVVTVSGEPGPDPRTA